MKSNSRAGTRQTTKLRKSRLPSSRLCSVLRATAEVLGALAALIAVLQGFKLWL